MGGSLLQHPGLCWHGSLDLFRGPHPSWALPVCPAFPCGFVCQVLSHGKRTRKCYASLIDEVYTGCMTCAVHGTLSELDVTLTDRLGTCQISHHEHENGATDKGSIVASSTRRMEAQRRKQVSESGSFRQKVAVGFERLALSEALSNIVLFCIFLNTVCMALEGVCSFEKDAYCPYMKATLEGLNITFGIVFTLELMIKVIGLGPRQFFRQAVNVLDVIIVVASLVELPGVLDSFRCYTAPVENAWEYESVLLPTSATVLSENVRQVLSVARAIRVDKELVANPLAYYACEGLCLAPPAVAAIDELNASAEMMCGRQDLPV